MSSIFRTAQVGGILASTAATSIATGLSAYLALKVKDIDPTYPGYASMVANLFSNVSTIVLSLIRDYFANPFGVAPSLVMAGIPMTNIEELSYGMSDRVLKYRSRGGIFLAHQEGGDQTLRIIGRSYGPMRYWLLTFLDFLFKWGTAKVADYFKNVTSIIGGSLYPKSADYFVEEIPEEYIEKTPWEIFDNENVEDGSGEWHLTFPVITRNRVYNNMYIETFEWEESVEKGLNVIEYTIFLRKFVPEFPLKFAEVAPIDEDKDSVYYFNVDYEDDFVSHFRFIDEMVDTFGSFSLLLLRTTTILAGNSPERNIAYIASYELNNELVGSSNYESKIKSMIEGLDENDSLTGLSVKNKEDLMQIA